MPEIQDLNFLLPEHTPRRAHIFQLKNPYVFMQNTLNERKCVLREDAIADLVTEFLSGRKLCSIENQSYDVPLFYIVTQRYPYFPITQEIFFCLLDLHRFQMAEVLGVSTTFLKTHKVLFGPCSYWYTNNIPEEVFAQIRSARDNMIQRMEKAGNEIILTILGEAKEMAEDEIAKRIRKNQEREYCKCQKNLRRNLKKKRKRREAKEIVSFQNDGEQSVNLPNNVIVEASDTNSAPESANLVFEGEDCLGSFEELSSLLDVWEPMEPLFETSDADGLCFS